MNSEKNNSSNNWRTVLKWEYIFVFMVSLTVVLTFLVLYLSQQELAKSKLCVSYQNIPIQDVPARCLNYFTTTPSNVLEGMPPVEEPAKEE